MNKKKVKQLIEKMNSYEPEYLYQRNEGKIIKYEIAKNYLIDIKTLVCFDKETTGLLGKTSKNIIGLIEVGDFVNGYKVISVDRDVTDIHTDCIELDLNNNYQYNFITINQIETIVTKEQFKEMEYRV